MEATLFATAVYTTLPYFIQLEAEYLRQKDRESFQKQLQKKTNYDFIVVGGGTAGCVLANRLSAHFSVLLLEAGGDPTSAASVPRFSRVIAHSRSINYLYNSIPQKQLHNRGLKLWAGKMLGGSGSHNFLTYNRGHPRDYDNWATIVNDSSWKYEELLKYFKRSEKYVGIWALNGQHGRKGPMRVETETSPLKYAWKAAAKQLGYKYGDPNGPQQIGFSPIDVTREKGRRASTYTAYLLPVLQRKTLTVIRYAEVQRLLISKGRVIGVKYLRHGKKFKVFSKRETVLSAGVCGTPLLLFKSGIGPAKMLRRAGIKVILDLPAVGKYLQDHYVTHVRLIPKSAYDQTAKNRLTEAEFENFIKFRKSTFLSFFGHSSQALIASSLAKAKNESDWPDVYIVLYDTFYNRSDIEIGVAVARPKLQFNRALSGSLKLNTTAYRLGERGSEKLALINDKALKSRRDIQVIREGLRFGIKVLQTRVLRRFGKLQPLDTECGARFKVNSVRYWNCYIASTVERTSHTVGTCRMGLEHDRKRSVLNSKLRVHGIQGLRIADASVIPQNTNANTNTPVIVVAEKAADIIISDNI